MNELNFESMLKIIHIFSTCFSLYPLKILCDFIFLFIENLNCFYIFFVSLFSFNSKLEFIKIKNTKKNRSSVAFFSEEKNALKSNKNYCIFCFKTNKKIFRTKKIISN